MTLVITKYTRSKIYPSEVDRKIFDHNDLSIIKTTLLTTLLDKKEIIEINKTFQSINIPTYLRRFA